MSEPTNNIKYDKVQQSAIDAAISLYNSNGEQRILPVAGRAGRGKSAIVAEIVRRINDSDSFSSIRLAAPTGQASVVLNRAMNKYFGNNPPVMPASTIHRMLGCRGGGDWVHNKNNKLYMDLLILDECSMNDVEILHRIIYSVSDSCKILMLGDHGQLPPVGAGCPFLDMVEAGLGIELETNYRQVGGSMLAESVERVYAGGMPMFGEKGSDSIGRGMPDDCFWHEQEDSEKVAESLAEIIHPWHRDNKSYMLVVPQKVGPVGFIKLNPIIQEIINPEGKGGLSIFGQTIKVGDIVRQQKNNYNLGESGVFNGFLGKVLDSRKTGITVEFPGWPNPEVVEYTKQEDWDALTLGYAITGHASQGSQADNVCCLVHPSNWYSLSRQWLYVAMSRAQKECHIVGSERAMKHAVSSNDAGHRNTYMSLALKDRADEKKMKHIVR